MIKQKLLLAEEFFRHDLRNKKHVKQGFTQEIERRTDGEYAPNDERTHGDARKAWKAQKEIEELEKEAENIMKSDEVVELDLKTCVEDALENLDSTAERYDKNIQPRFEAEDYTVNTHRTAEKVVYNLLDNSIQHGERQDIELVVDEYEEGLEMEVMDGGEADFDELLPGSLERRDYRGTGTYLIDRVIDITNLDVENREEGYSLRFNN